jgi:putative FmdB family regulatory protein
MPTYDYECKACQNRFEVFQNMSDPPVSRCPKCGKGAKRLIGGGLGIIFKGSGFYVTDNKKGASAASSGGKAKEKDAKTGEASSPAPAAEKGGEKKEAKPEAKAAKTSA